MRPMPTSSRNGGASGATKGHGAVSWRIRYQDAAAGGSSKRLAKNPSGTAPWPNRNSVAVSSMSNATATANPNSSPSPLHRTLAGPTTSPAAASNSPPPTATAKPSAATYSRLRPPPLDALEREPELIDRYISDKIRQASRRRRSTTSSDAAGDVEDRHPLAADPSQPRAPTSTAPATTPRPQILNPARDRAAWTAYPEHSPRHRAASSAPGGGSPTRSPSPPSAPPCAAANYSPSAGTTSNSSTNLTVREALVKGRFTTPKSRPEDADPPRPTHQPAPCRPLAANRYKPTRTTSSTTPTKAPPSTPPASPANTSAPHSMPPESRNPSGPSTTSATPPHPRRSSRQPPHLHPNARRPLPSEHH